MPAKSMQQYQYMRGICDGNIKPPEGMTKEQACEYVAGQSPEGLPEKITEAGKGIVIGHNASDWLDAAY